MSKVPVSRRRRWMAAIGTAVIILLLVAYLLPYLLKRHIEQHSEEWINRRITIERIVLNPFTFTYGIDGVTCYEPKSDEVFVAWKRIAVRSNLWAGLRRNEWHLKGLRVEAPYVHIVQNGNRFNFTDLLEMGGTDSLTADTTGAETVFSMEDIELSDGRVDYLSDALAAPLTISAIKATSNLISSARARMAFDVGLETGQGGRLDGGFVLDTDQERYAINAGLRGFALGQLLPYLQEFFACKELDGELDVDLHLTDSYTDSSSLAISGGMGLRGVRLLDPNGEELFGLRSAEVRLDTLVAGDQRVEMGAVRLEGAALAFALLADGSDNWTRLLKLDSASVEADSAATLQQISESNVFVMLADYIRYLGEQVVASKYTAKRMELTGASVRFEDHTPDRPFSYAITDIEIVANSFSSDQEAGHVAARAVLQQTGWLKANAVFDPKDIRNVRLDLDLDALDLRALDAYGRWYAAHPLEEGTLRYSTSTSISGGMIDSKNHLRIDDLKLGKKTGEHAPDIYVLPLRLAAGLLKDVHGVVELEVPVQGDLRDPEFKPWPIVWQVLKNLVIKIAAAPGRLLMRALDGTNEDALERIRFDHLQTELTDAQAKTLRLLAQALASKPELHVDLVSMVDSMAEAREVALFEAKHRYLLPDRTELSREDSARVAELSTKDSSFVDHVEERTPNLEGKPLRDRCMVFCGAAQAMSVQAELEYARREIVMQYLLAEGVPAGRVSYREGTREELAGKRGEPGFLFVFGAAE